MKTPLRGEMLRGADFIIGVVSNRGSDPFQTIFKDRHRLRNYWILHSRVVTIKYIFFAVAAGSGETWHCSVKNIFS